MDPSGSINSTNAEPRVLTSGERAPLILRRRFFSRFFKSSGTTQQESGYVEFGGHNENGSRTLDTFSGVFSPVALSMFSALLFLRVGFIIGNAGLLWALTQFLIAYVILVFTVASICAVSTNGAVEGGGAYFMISRTLGPEFGGSIGTLFFLANVVSSALYLTGCVEGLVDNLEYLNSPNESPLPDGRWWRFLYCSFLNLLNFLLTLTGAGMFAKASASTLAVVLTCLLSCIISFLSQKEIDDVHFPRANTLYFDNVTANYTGFSRDTLWSNLNSNYSADYTSTKSFESAHFADFATVFGVLFSGVTGIMAGANMSGELKEPAKSIPRGTLSAVGFTFVCYVIMAVMTAATCSRFLLQNNYIYLLPINVWPPFIVIGIVTATFSASLSNFIGSSRVLDALAKDNVYGFLLKFVNVGNWKGNPIAAVFVSFVLVELVLLIGSLNLIAQINSVLFLLSYLATNLACLGLELASAPNFRPSFKYFTWYTAFIGLVCTLIMMFVISPIYASSSIILCFVLFVFLHLFSPSRQYQWGSISQALIFHQVRKYLLLLDPRKDHVKFWRPQILLLVNNPRTCCPLISFVNDIKKGGLYVLGHVQAGMDWSAAESDPTIDEYPHWLALVDHLKVKAFVELTIAKTVREGFHHLVRLSGMGAMKPNTIFLGFYDEEVPLDFLHIENPNQLPASLSQAEDVFKMRDSTRKDIDVSEYVALIKDVFKLKKNLCICRHFQNFDKLCVKRSNSKFLNFIDIWPVNFFCPNERDPFETTSLFMLQLACILQMVPGWKKLPLRVFLCEHNPNRIAISQHRLRQLLVSLRISAKIIQVDQWQECQQLIPGGSLYSQLATESNTKTYLQRVNAMIKSYSDSTATLFLYLPMEYAKGEIQDESGCAPATYLQHLTLLSTQLPPTVLVHGIHGVTSTTL